MHDGVQSFRVISSGTIDDAWSINAYAQCAGTYSYQDPGTVIQGAKPDHGCTNLPDHANLFTFEGLPPHLAEESTTSYHIAYSAESSLYFGYQAYANYYAFQTSNQVEGTGYTRLLTSSEPDDLMNTIPTFQAPRLAFSHRYSPINKPDVVAKWFESDQAPTEEVIVLIDPDNWLLQPIAKYASRVKKGHALAQQAFFYRNPKVKELYQLFCEKNCGYTPDDAAVPYFVHRDDLKAIAPLWRDLTIKIKERTIAEPDLNQRFKAIQLDWCAEMYGYVFAAAELGIRHTIKGKLQLRDVDQPVPPREENRIPMIHMGRAWFPKGDPTAEQWRHTEGEIFNYRGIQVWCKCNWTASHIIPWPVPSGSDFASRETLRILHDSMEAFGPLPKSKYRGDASPYGYHVNFP
uniref:Hydroxyproline O-arabinosyltransferase-like domain-containing protein n=1 Tax=Lotharella oceanica TaxID=641309 RepID=A0A7S2U1S0_9EUKA|mmetsp:Transcript_6335/g.12614  ORF Transcript_6335/g.12614 Transcript_6335/m.12614 type:complete len:405 (+) Transcript_6335:156-1370(+)